MKKNHTNSENMGYVLFLSIVAALGGFLFGYDTAVISGTIKGVSTQFNMNDIQSGWFVGSALLGSIGGVLVAGRLSDLFGRRPVLFASAVLFSASAIGCMLSPNEQWLVFYRIIGGIGIGVASVISPLYISEISVPRYRGRLVSLYQLAITVGFLGAYMVNYALKIQAENWQVSANIQSGWINLVFEEEVWRSMLGAEAIPALLFFITLFFIPESPRWLIVKHKNTQSLRILSRIQGEETAIAQLKEIKRMVQLEVQSNWRLLFQHGYRTAMIIGISLAILGQFMGVNAVLYYGPSIFEQTGLSEGDSLFYQVFVGLINVISTVIAIWLIDKIGRKKLIYYGVSVMLVSLILIALYFQINKTSMVIPPVTLLVLILAYIFGCAISICVVIWVLLSEMYPTKVRGAAMSFAGFSLWVGTYLIGQLTPWLMTSLSATGLFLLFALMCLPYLWITWKLVPETTGKSLEEIEQMWMTH
ncbi:sugar porter family MFS transporter [Prolixibacter sp. NT017]|uniref:sugar porter family MFS transporter n=1 Tax=Prolixibacter sp. NT017 TaxID=2652390 RepID=UPI001E2E9F41|nr:sugar porter family MFS transporter [Prolixibacter sp. NT017]